jgi:hypothetical protein
MVQSNTVVDVAASVAAVTATAGFFYARTSARAARHAEEAARRAVELAQRSRQAADRARLRQRVERVGELVQAIATSSQADPNTEQVSPRTRSQCTILNRAVIGLRDILPLSAELCRAGSPGELMARAGNAGEEIDGVLTKLTRHRPHSAYRPRGQVPWHRPATSQAPSSSGATGHDVGRLPTP